MWHWSSILVPWIFRSLSSIFEDICQSKNELPPAIIKFGGFTRCNEWMNSVKERETKDFYSVLCVNEMKNRHFSIAHCY